MNIYPRRTIFRRRDETSVYRMFLWVVLILGGVWLIRSVNQGEVKPLFLPTPTPTRFAQSYIIEADALFTAGKLEDSFNENGVLEPGAITVYLEASRVDPNNAEVWAELSRVQTYSTRLQVKREDIVARLDEAILSAERAVELNPDSSYAHAIHSFALNWRASYTSDDRERQAFLTKAEQEAVRALQLDNTSALALAFYAEVLVDQQKWTQALQTVQQALDRDSSLMDVHRVHGYVLESLGEYALAIDAYERAIKITPNLTFLYIQVGAGYRVLAFRSPNEEVQRSLFEKSLEYFAQAARINQQLGVRNPGPYVSIARTYSQMGEFFIAIRNIQRAIEFEPDNAVLYGELGVLYHKNRNYETGILALKCAIRGCTEEESCDGRGGCGRNDVPSVVSPLSLSQSTVYYFDIYASQLAALSTPRQSYCPEALAVASLVEASPYISDPNIAADMVVVRTICSFDADATARAGSTPTPAP